MFNILTFNRIAAAGLSQFPTEQYHISDNNDDPDAILLRSHKLHDMSIPSNLKAVARAGAGVNNIPIDAYTDAGIPVFNTPGANANAVKELVIAGMLLACRNICQGWVYANKLSGNDSQISSDVEKGKKQFVGYELPGKTLAVVGLGAIGVKVANTGLSLGMNVVGYDPGITIQRAWELSSDVKKASSLSEAIKQADFISVHVPYNEHTHHLINSAFIQQCPKGVVVLNFARGDIVNSENIVAALNDEQIHAYVCDFPDKHLINHPKVIALPHLGASTKEAEENCAVMAAQTLRSYLEDGEIINSVNFPTIQMPRDGGIRITIANRNIPNMVGQISTLLGESNINITDMINKSRDDIAYTLVDVSDAVSNDVIHKIQSIEGVLSVRILGNKL